MIFKTRLKQKEIRGHWNIEWLVSISQPSKTFLGLAVAFQMPVELSGMREDSIDEVENILREVLYDFEKRRSNGRTRFVGYIHKNEDHFIVGYDKNGDQSIDCLKICIK